MLIIFVELLDFVLLGLMIWVYLCFIDCFFCVYDVFYYLLIFDVVFFFVDVEGVVCVFGVVCVVGCMFIFWFGGISFFG